MNRIGLVWIESNCGLCHFIRHSVKDNVIVALASMQAMSVRAACVCVHVFVTVLVAVPVTFHSMTTTSLLNLIARDCRSLPALASIFNKPIPFFSVSLPLLLSVRLSIQLHSKCVRAGAYNKFKPILQRAHRVPITSFIVKRQNSIYVLECKMPPIAAAGLVVFIFIACIQPMNNNNVENRIIRGIIYIFFSEFHFVQ